MTYFDRARNIENVPAPDEWDFGLTAAVDSLLMEGKDPFDFPEELEARVVEVLAESEWDILDDSDFVEAFGDFEDIEDGDLWLDS